ncbi:MAG: ATP-binding protein [Bacteroidia bacterium]|nr:ATP-binding protein [Bacteroidia bacterium]
MIFNRLYYINKLISHKHNKMVKVVTGIRRSGKSFLLFELFRNHLIDNGVREDHIITIALDDRLNKQLRDPDACLSYIRNLVKDKDMYYVMIDEVQLMDEFVDVLNSLLHLSNVDAYVTGSNSKFLSSDVITEFRGRGDEIHINPLSMNEICEAMPDIDWNRQWELYMTYGGLPMTVLYQSEKEKADYLKKLLKETYLRDIKERHKIANDLELEQLLNMLASSVGSLTNPQKLSDTFLSSGKMKLSANTIKQYLDYLCEAYLIDKSERFDIKGKRYISTPYKFYFTDLGLRNAKLNFRQIEETHLMENAIYNELIMRDFNVDVGVVEVREKDGNDNSVRKHIEVDFVVNQGSKRYYIQSAFALPNVEKVQQETRPLINIPDSFKKIIVVKDDILLRRDDNGIVTMGLKQFLMDSNSLDL